MRKNKPEPAYQSIECYLNLPWSYTVEQWDDEDGEGPYFVVRVNELPGVCTDAPTVTEAMALIKEPMEAAFRLYMKNSEPIPEPVKSTDYKGQISYRTTSRKHYLLAKEAQRRGVTINRLIDEAVDEKFAS